MRGDMVVGAECAATWRRTLNARRPAAAGPPPLAVGAEFDGEMAVGAECAATWRSALNATATWRSALNATATNLSAATATKLIARASGRRGELAIGAECDHRTAMRHRRTADGGERGGKMRQSCEGAVPLSDESR